MLHLWPNDARGKHRGAGLSRTWLYGAEAERRPRRMREGRGLRRRVRGRGIADPDPSRRTGILLDQPGYLNGLLTPFGDRVGVF
jgi:hypothetical protein